MDVTGATSFARITAGMGNCIRPFDSMPTSKRTPTPVNASLIERLIIDISCL